MKIKTVVLNERADAGNPHVRFDEGEVASYPPTVGRPEGAATRGAEPRRGLLLYIMTKVREGSRFFGMLLIVGGSMLPLGPALGVVADASMGHVTVWQGHAINAMNHASAAKSYYAAVALQESEASPGTSSSARTYSESEIEWNQQYKAQKDEEANPTKVSTFQARQYMENGYPYVELTWQRKDIPPVVMGGSASWYFKVDVSHDSTFLNPASSIKTKKTSGYGSGSVVFTIDRKDSDGIQLYSKSKYYARITSCCKVGSSERKSAGQVFAFELDDSTTPENAEFEAMKKSWSDGRTQVDISASFGSFFNTLSWMTVDVSKSPTFASSSSFSVPVTTDTKQTFSLPSLSASSEPYYFRANVTDCMGNTSSWKSLGSLTLTADTSDTSGPSMTTCKASIVNGLLKVEWSEPYDKSGVSCYQVQVASGASFGNILADTYLSARSFTWQVDGNYSVYVRVRAKDGKDNWGSWGSTVSAQGVPIVTGLTALQKGTNYYQFQWLKIDGISRYELQVSSSVSFSSTVVSQTVNGNASPWGSISGSGTWHYRVRAIAPNGTKGAWSVSSFPVAPGNSQGYRKVSGASGSHMGMSVSVCGGRMLALGAGTVRIYSVSSDASASRVASFSKLASVGTIADTWYALGNDSENNGAGVVWLGTSSSPSATLTSPNSVTGGGFGSSVSMSGSRLAVGAAYEKSNAGRVYVYENDGSGWKLKQTLTGTGEESFGLDVSMSGDWLFVGAPGACPDADSTGACYVYHRSSSGAWSLYQSLPARLLAQSFGTTVCVNGDRAAVSSYRDWCFEYPQGGAVVYRLEDGEWKEDGYLRPDMHGINESHCGAITAISGDWACLGGFDVFDPTVQDSTVVDNGGSVVLFHRQNGRWSECKRLYPYDAFADQWFGVNFAMSGNRLVVGAPESLLKTGSGAVYVVDLQSGFSEAIPPPSVVSLKPVVTENHELEFDCSALLASADAYELQVDDDSLDYDSPVLSVHGSERTVRSVPLKIRDYCYRVRVCRDGMWSDWSDDGLLSVSTSDGKLASYRIAFNANGGSGSMPDQVCGCNIREVLFANAFYRSGYAFAGWATSSSGSVRYSDGESVSLSTTEGAVVTLYAKWTQTAVRPSNDNIANAKSISGSSGSTTGSNVDATNESGEPNHGASGAVNSVWWKWTAPSSGSVTFSTEGSGFDTGIAVYTGSSISSLSSSKIADNDDNGSGGSWSKVTFDAVSGTTYRIAVAGYSGKSGSISLKWSLTVPVATYTVSYSAGAYGSGSRSPSTKTHGVSLTLPGAAFTRTGYTQTGWSTDYYGSAKTYSLSGSYTSNSGTTLYPYWTANTYSISYSLNGGSHGSTHPTGATYDSAFSVSAPSRSGYTFAGWTVTSGLNTSTAKWGTSSSPSTSISSSSTKCVNGTGSVYFKNLTATSGGSVTLTANWAVDPMADFEISDGVLTKYKGTGGAVTVPSGVTSIGDKAFYNCSGLTSVTIPSSVTSIWDYAFAWCDGLTSVTIPSSVTSIGIEAFYSCDGLTSVTIPSSVTSIGSWAFTSCGGLTSINVNSANRYYCSIGGVLYNKEASVLICCPGGARSVTIPSSVTSINWSAFKYCSGLTSVTIPEGVTSIGFDAFYGCSGLTSVTIPEGVTSIISDAFAWCSGLTSVTIPSSVTSIDCSAFKYCSGLTSINVNSANRYYCSIDGVLYNKEASVLICCPGGARSVTIPEGVTSIGGGAFYGCSGLTSVTIPSSVTSIGRDAFYGCNGLTTVYVSPGDVERVKTLYSFGASVKVVDPYEPTDVSASDGSYADKVSVSWTTAIGVSSCDIYRSTTTNRPDTAMATGVTSPFDDEAAEPGTDYYYWISAISPEGLSISACDVGYRSVSLSLDKSVDAYSDAGGNGSVSVAANTSWSAATDAGWITLGMESGSGDGTLTYTVAANTSITSRTGTVTVTAGANTSHPATKTVTIVQDVALFVVVDGVLRKYTGDGGAVTIPANVTSIAGAAFYGCSGLTSVTIPTNVMSIGEGAFSGCSGLTSMTLPFVGAKRGVTNTKEALFGYIFGSKPYAGATKKTQRYDNWPHLVTCYIPDSLRSVVITDETIISWGAFSLCGGLVSVVLPSSVTSIDGWAFYGCHNLESITIPPGVTNLGMEAFRDCEKLTSVTIPSSVTSIGDCAFLTYDQMVNVYVDRGDVRRIRSLMEAYNLDVTQMRFREVGTEDRSTITSGVKVEIDPGLVGWTPSGLPSGLKYDKTTGMITGTATKPGEYVVKFTKNGMEPETLTIVVTALPKLSVALVGSGTGKVSGAGEHLANAKVTLKATADTKDAAATVKSAFAGWFADADCTQPLDGTVDYRTASFPYVMPAEDVAIYAKFVAVAEDAARLSVANIVEGETFTVNDSWTKKVEVDSYSIPSVSAKGLPSGLKFDAKTLTISGKPTKPGKYDIELSLKNASVKTAKEFAFKIVVPNLESDWIADGINSASDAYTYVAGTKITPILPVLAEGVTVKATGLPSGLKLVGGKNGVPYSIEGTSTAKPGAYTVTLTLTKGKEKETATITVNIENRKLDLVMATCGGSLTNGCKVTGGGSYAAGKKVTLKATAAKGAVFAGWYRNPDCTEALAGTVDYRTTSYSYVTTDQDETIYAKFVPAADDGTIGLAVNGNEVLDDTGAVRVVVKDAATLPTVVLGSVSIPKASVKGLPAGLKWDAKKNCFTGAPTKPGVYKVAFSLTNTTVKKAIVRAFTIEVPNFESPAFPGLKSASDAYPVSVGVAALPAVDAGLASAYAGYTVKVTGLPTGLTWKNGVLTGLAKKAGDYTVTFTATKGKDKQVSTITIHVEALPDWAVGTFVGMVRQVDRDERGEIVEDEDGLHDWYDILTTVSVTSAGKVSGMLHFESGTDVSFKSDSISERTDVGYVVRGQLKARGIASDFELILRKIGIEATGVGDLGAVDVLMRQTSRQEGSSWIECGETTFSTDEDAPLRQNVWSSKELPLPPSVNGVKKTVTVEDDVYTLTFGKNGSVKVSLAKADKPTKAIASGSATLSIVEYVSGEWNCELCTSVVVKKNDYGAVRIFDVTISADGTVICLPQK